MTRVLFVNSRSRSCGYGMPRLKVSLLALMCFCLFLLWTSHKRTSQWSLSFSSRGRLIDLHESREVRMRVGAIVSVRNLQTVGLKQLIVLMDNVLMTTRRESDRSTPICVYDVDVVLAVGDWRPDAHDQSNTTELLCTMLKSAHRCVSQCMVATSWAESLIRSKSSHSATASISSTRSLYVPTLGEAINGGYEALHMTSSHYAHEYVFVMDASRAPVRGRGDDGLLNSLLRDVASPAFAADGGRPVLIAPVTLSSEASNAHVLDAGWNITLGQSSGRTSPIFARNWMGVASRHDGDSPVAVDSVGPHCFLLATRALANRSDFLIPFASHRTVIDTHTNQVAAIREILAMGTALAEQLETTISFQGELAALQSVSHTIRTTASLQHLNKDMYRLVAEGEKALSSDAVVANVVRQRSQRLKVMTPNYHNQLSIDFLKSKNNHNIRRPSSFPRRVVETQQHDENPKPENNVMLSVNDSVVSILEKVSLRSEALRGALDGFLSTQQASCSTCPEELYGLLLSLALRQSLLLRGLPGVVAVSRRSFVRIAHEGLPRGIQSAAQDDFIRPSFSMIDANDVFKSVAPFINAEILNHRLRLQQSLGYFGEVSPPAHAPIGVGGHKAMRRGPLLRIVWDSYCCRCCGFSNEMVHLIHPLVTAGFDVRVTPGGECFCPGLPLSISDSIARLHVGKEHIYSEHLTSDEIIVWVSHTEPTAYPSNNRADTVYKRRPDYIVGRSMYELSKIDMAWVTILNDDMLCDEVWVPSTFVKRVFVESGVEERKVAVIPEAIDVWYFDPDIIPSIPLPEGLSQWRHMCNREPSVEVEHTVKFFSSFKWEERKGWDLLLDAYIESFASDGSNVSLYILTHLWFPTASSIDRHNLSFVVDRVTERVLAPRNMTFSQMPHICFILEDLSEATVASLYQSTDAFVLPTRGEGWGLPIMQAMSMSKPTIATGHGGQMDYMTAHNSFLIDVERMEEIPKDSVYGWAAGKNWAVPSLVSTVYWMRHVARNLPVAKRVGAQGRADIVARYSEDAVATLVASRLWEIRDIVTDRRQKQNAS